MKPLSGKEIGVGFITYKIMNTTKAAISIFIFFEFGENLNSFVYMCSFTLMFTFFMLIFYDSTQVDFLLVEVRKIIDKESKIRINWFKKILILISIIVYDSFLVVIYYRDGSYQWNNIPTMKIYVLFILSIFVTNSLGYIILKQIF